MTLTPILTNTVGGTGPSVTIVGLDGKDVHCTHEDSPFIGENSDCLNENPDQTRYWHFEECNTKTQGSFSRASCGGQVPEENRWRKTDDRSERSCGLSGF